MFVRFAFRVGFHRPVLAVVSLALVFGSRVVFGAGAQKMRVGKAAPYARGAEISKD